METQRYKLKITAIKLLLPLVMITILLYISYTSLYESEKKSLSLS